MTKLIPFAQTWTGFRCLSLLCWFLWIDHKSWKVPYIPMGMLTFKNWYNGKCCVALWLNNNNQNHTIYLARWYCGVPWVHFTIFIVRLYLQMLPPHIASHLASSFNCMFEYFCPRYPTPWQNLVTFSHTKECKSLCATNLYTKSLNAALVMQSQGPKVVLKRLSIYA